MLFNKRVRYVKKVKEPLGVFWNSQHLAVSRPGRGLRTFQTAVTGVHVERKITGIFQNKTKKSTSEDLLTFVASCLER